MYHFQSSKSLLAIYPSVTAAQKCNITMENFTQSELLLLEAIDQICQQDK